MQGNVQPLQELGGQSLVPDMMYGTLDIFNPHNAKLTSAAAAGGLTMHFDVHCCSRSMHHERNGFVTAFEGQAFGSAGV